MRNDDLQPGDALLILMLILAVGCLAVLYNLLIK